MGGALGLSYWMPNHVSYNWFSCPSPLIRHLFFLPPNGISVLSFSCYITIASRASWATAQRCHCHSADPDRYTPQQLPTTWCPSALWCHRLIKAFGSIGSGLSDPFPLFCGLQGCSVRIQPLPRRAQLINAGRVCTWQRDLLLIKALITVDFRSCDICNRTYFSRQKLVTFVRSFKRERHLADDWLRELLNNNRLMLWSSLKIANHHRWKTVDNTN